MYFDFRKNSFVMQLSKKVFILEIDKGHFWMKKAYAFNTKNMLGFPYCLLTDFTKFFL